MVKNILLKLELEGQGIVNYDSNDQKWVLDQTPLRNNGKHSNVSYAKKNFYKDENDKLFYKIKISSDSLKHDMFKGDVIAQTPNIAYHSTLLYNYMASPLSLIRGYLFTEKETFKRKGAITLCDAEQTCDAISSINVFSRSGEKKEGKVDDKGDTTFYSKETVGKIKYESIGNIDLMGLQFISCDSVFDRYSFNPDYYNLYKQFLCQKIPNFNSELGYYQQRNSSIEIPEYGVLLNEENVVYLVKESLKRLLAINIKRKDSYAKVVSLKIKWVEKPNQERFNNEDNWITISSDEDIDKLDFEPYMFYSLVDYDKAKKDRMEIEKEIEKALKDKKKKSDTDKKPKKSKDDE